ncbi:hypothetical protein ANCDUO_04351 [Ancylostoma duodenale]|uniref:Metalloprotease TIKI homolog n=1 Tax=Ancylostoma duodenale TaxID=51022 RepID=A0A0C2DRG5_9BILA|nr:hypothetical protein ANCDUO_04351 [Ancylostoma duodenale]
MISSFTKQLKIVFEVSDRVREAFSYSDTLLLEIDLRNEYTVRRLIRCKNLRRKQTAASYLDPKLYQRIKDFMARFRRSLISWAQSRETHQPDLYRKAKEMYENLVGNWERKRPEWLLFALYQLCENLLDRPTSPMLDVFLANKAYEEEKQIRAIETTQEQCNPIRSLTQEEHLTTASRIPLAKNENNVGDRGTIKNRKTHNISQWLKGEGEVVLE